MENSRSFLDLENSSSYVVEELHAPSTLSDNVWSQRHARDHATVSQSTSLTGYSNNSTAVARTTFVTAAGLGCTVIEHSQPDQQLNGGESPDLLDLDKQSFYDEHGDVKPFKTEPVHSEHHYLQANCFSTGEAGVGNDTYMESWLTEQIRSEIQYDCARLTISPVNMETKSKLKRTLMCEVVHFTHRSPKRVGGRLLMFIFITSAITATLVQGSQSTCDAPPALKSAITNVTCIFPENIINSKVNVYINHYLKDIIKDEIVLICKSSKGTFNCSGIPSYQFVTYERDFTADKYKLIAQISEVNHRHAGKYCCDFSWFGDSRENQCEECTLEVKENLSTSENYTMKEITESDASSFIFHLTVALGIILLLMILVTIVIVICLYKRHKKQRPKIKVKDEAKSSNSEESGPFLTSGNAI